MVIDFYLPKYKELINSIISGGIPVYTVEQWLKNKVENGILLRHDVDRFSENVYQMAKLEYDHGINSTYYFRIKKSVFNPELIKNVYNLGHEIGYHYEDLATTGGNYKEAIKLFQSNLEKIRSIVPVNTIAMHGKALSSYNSLDLWNNYNWENYSLKGEAFLSIDYTNMYYFTDTGRNWDPSLNNLRDKVDNSFKSQKIKNTNDLITFIHQNKQKKIALVIHPERWPHNYGNYIKSFLADSFFNTIKKTLKLIRN